MSDVIRPVIAKTASFTIRHMQPDRPGTRFTNRGATGAITATLPAPAPALKGVWYEFFGVADQNFIVSAGAGKAVVVNSAASASLAMQTSSQKIGGKIRATCDGTSWLLEGVVVGITYTAA